MNLTNKFSELSAIKLKQVTNILSQNDILIN
jgi:hypothetical protein